ncbi:hypothetical protein CRYUN_Cryun09bG0070500 [Craigia yunnanensis]
MIKKKYGQDATNVGDEEQEAYLKELTAVFVYNAVTYRYIAKPILSKGISINDIHLSSNDLEMYIDLAPLINPSPYVVPEDMSLTKIYNIFHQLGLRHIFVVPRASCVITRKDLLIDEESEDSATMD